MKRGVFADITAGRLLEMNADHKGETVRAVIESMIDYEKNFNVVATDMAGDYHPVIQLCLPCAKHVVDKYPLFQNLSRRVTEV